MKKSLVLEGGGMRGMYTAGVTDVFMENNINFDRLKTEKLWHRNLTPKSTPTPTTTPTANSTKMWQRRPS